MSEFMVYEVGLQWKKRGISNRPRDIFPGCGHCEQKKIQFSHFHLMLENAVTETLKATTKLLQVPLLKIKREIHDSNLVSLSYKVLQYSRIDLC